MNGAMTPYQRRLLVFLSVATFFEGYDFLALSQILPNLREAFHLSPTEGGVLVGVINAGTILAWFIVRLADRIGRRPVLSLTIAGYTITSLLSGLAPNIYLFAIAQLLARMFLLGEWAVAMVFAAEEYPAERRGAVIGIIQAFSSIGSIACAAVVPKLLHMHSGWRNVYFVGAIPLVIIAFARRSIQETKRFVDVKLDATSASSAPDLMRIVRGPYRRRVLQLAAIWGLTYACTNVVITFWKEFAVHERGFDDRAFGKAIALASIVAIPLVLVSGRMLDALGRRRGAIVIYVLGGAGTYLAYTARDRTVLTVGIIFAVFGASGVLPVLNAFTTELFPTSLRADAYAWANNLLGRISYVLVPPLIGAAAEHTGWGPAVALTVIPLALALVLILAMLPETTGRELEETAALTASVATNVTRAADGTGET
jgi:putative MFS transporter